MGTPNYMSPEYSNCPNEPVVWDTQELCDALMVSPYYSKQKAYIDCKLAKEKCNAAGKTDTASITSCADLYKVLNDCIAANPM